MFKPRQTFNPRAFFHLGVIFSRELANFHRVACFYVWGEK